MKKKFLIVFLFFLPYNVFSQSDYCDLLVYPYKSAEFKGGVKAMHLFIKENKQYPRAAVRANIKVFVKFLITVEGKIDSIFVVKKLGFGCDEEAIRVVQKMAGKWSPKENTEGKYISSFYTLPIKFDLDENGN